MSDAHRHESNRSDRLAVPAIEGLSPQGVWLVFETVVTDLGQGRSSVKHYARTPGGEYAFSDSQGLYEWRRDAHGRSRRIDHTGGDRAGAQNGKRLFSTSPGGPKAAGRDESLCRSLGVYWGTRES